MKFLSRSFSSFAYIRLKLKTCFFPLRFHMFFYLPIKCLIGCVCVVEKNISNETKKRELYKILYIDGKGMTKLYIKLLI